MCCCVIFFDKSHTHTHTHTQRLAVVSNRSHKVAQACRRWGEGVDGGIRNHKVVQARPMSLVEGRGRGEGDLDRLCNMTSLISRHAYTSRVWSDSDASSLTVT